MTTRPRPVRPSTLRLPATRPAGVDTVFAYFVRHFPQIPAREWRRRFEADTVWTDAGAVAIDAPFVPLVEVHYRRELAHEPPVRRDYRVVWQDGHLMVVDKPPNLPVTPGGRWVRNCLLNLLDEAAGNHDTAPLHRLDRLSSGLLLLSRDPSSRTAHARLMRRPGVLEKTYTAVCEAARELTWRRCSLRHHIARSSAEPWRQEVRPELPANARAEATVVARAGDLVLLRVRLVSGRKHQLRVQLAHEGLPILGDPLYGKQPPYRDHDLSQRIWLDAHQLVVTGFDRGPGEAPLSAVWSSSREPSAFFERARAWRARRRQLGDPR